MKSVKFTAAYFFKHGEVFCSNRLTITTTLRLHTHDFAEVFWVESGTGIHLINGRRQTLTPGTLVFVRPTDCHSIRARRGTAGLTMLDLAFPLSTLDFFRHRYFATATTFFWATTALPFTLQLDANELKWLAGWAKALRKDWVDRMRSDIYLLELFSKLLRKFGPTAPAPPWLQHALSAIREPQHFRRGTPAFARLANHCPRHTSRLLRQHFSLTATEVVNQARMQFAAQELAAGEKKILDISLECGFQNPNHFHRVFRKYYKTTPHQYRQHQRALLPEPVE